MDHKCLLQPKIYKTLLSRYSRLISVTKTYYNHLLINKKAKSLLFYKIRSKMGKRLLSLEDVSLLLMEILRKGGLYFVLKIQVVLKIEVLLSLEIKKRKDTQVKSIWNL